MEGQAAAIQTSRPNNGLGTTADGTPCSTKSVEDGLAKTTNCGAVSLLVVFARWLVLLRTGCWVTELADAAPWQPWLWKRKDGRKG